MRSSERHRRQGTVQSEADGNRESHGNRSLPSALGLTLTEALPCYLDYFYN